MDNVTSIGQAREAQRKFEEYHEVAKKLDKIPAHIAISESDPNWDARDLWPESKTISGMAKKKSVDLIGDYDCLLTRAVKDVCGVLAFPESTAFIHCLSIISSATIRSFDFEFFGANVPCGLYTVTAQPSGAGKSPVHNVFFKPLAIEVADMNKENRVKRAKIIAKIKLLEAELKGEKNESVIDDKTGAIAEYQDELDSNPEYIFNTSNATVESLEPILKNNGGCFTIVSDEKEAIELLVGNSYQSTEKGSSKNIEVLLRGFDRTYFSSARVGRSGYSGFISGSVSVMAQSSTVETLFDMGANGRGISERFIILDEPDLFHVEQPDYRPIDKHISKQIHDLIQAIYREEKTTLIISESDKSDIMKIKKKYRSLSHGQGKFSNAMARGFVSKAPYHIAKIASLLHIIEEWGDGGTRSRTISKESLKRSVFIFDKITKSYLNAIEMNGKGGIIAQCNDLVDYISNQYSRNKSKFILHRKIYDRCKHMDSFKQYDSGGGCAAILKNDVYPMLEKLGYGFLFNNKFYINKKAF